jgi:hypothetical protein
MRSWELLMLYRLCRVLRLRYRSLRQSLVAAAAAAAAAAVVLTLPFAFTVYCAPVLL